MGKAMRYWRWIPFAAGLAIPAAYCLGRLGNIPYLDGFMGNWLATVLGAIVGIPIALAISERERRAQAREDSERREQELAARRTLVLQLIAQELTYNTNLLHKRAADKQPGDLIRAESRPKDEMWQALSDGGELRYIADLSLVATITEAYHRLRAREKWGEHVWEARLTPDFQPGRLAPALERGIADGLSRGDLEVIECMEEALAAVHRALQGAKGTDSP